MIAATSPPRFATLVLATGLSVLSLNMFLPSLPAIAETFDADYGLVNLAIAGYAGFTALLQLIMGPLSDRFGRRPVILCGMALFLAASVGCLLAPTIELFLLCRMVQGAVIAGYVVSLAVIRDTASEGEAASRIGYLSMAMAVAPMLAPMAGGLIGEVFGWQATFWAFILLGGLALILVWADLGETNLTRAATLTAQFRRYPALLGSIRFWAYAACMATSTGAFYAFLAGAPLVASRVLGLSTGDLGIAMGTITAGYMLGSFLSGRFAARTRLTTMMLIGRCVACAGLIVGLILYQSGVVHLLAVFGATVWVGIGNGLTVPSASAGALSVRPDLAGSASGLLGAMAVGGGGLISAVTGPLLSANGLVSVWFGMMLASAGMGLAAVLVLIILDRRAARAL